jgi:hypothetical protein
VHGDFTRMTADSPPLDAASCVYLYLLRENVVALAPLLRALVARGRRVVTFDAPIPELEHRDSDLFGMIRLYADESVSLASRGEFSQW